MGEIFLSIITEGVLAKVSSLALDKISEAWNIKPELTKLQNSLSTIKAVILDADQQKYKNHEVRDWLEKLKDSVYEIDDFLDDLFLEVSPRNDKFTLKKVRSFFSCSNPFALRFKIGHRIKGLRQKLDEISEDRKKFHFTEQYHLNPVENVFREQTHSYVRAAEIIGRDKDRESLVQLVLSPSNEEKVSVIPVVGMGGLGKTTVVQLVYNDSRVIQSFDLGMWISVSEDFSVGRVVDMILKSATGEDFSNLDMDQMQSILADVLNDKRYLLVLDDVWNEDRNIWMDLLELLMNCREGSKIIVTTRSKEVATITNTSSSYHLGGLTEDDCLSLFLKCAFKGPDVWLPNLVTIGKEIVKKCGGVPLAVKTLGRLLYLNIDEQEWLHIKDSDIWEIDQKQTDILPLLRLTFERLPSHLKQCFAYCSMLPKGLEIPREVFINLWVAQGFVQTINKNRQPEDIGNQYFNELLSRFCFQDVKEAFDGEILACKIHDLVHDLALSVGGPECLTIKSDTKRAMERVRHLYIHAEDLSRRQFLRALFKSKKVRSFRCAAGIKHLDVTSIKVIVSNFRRVRVLILNSLELEELPSSIGDLKRLRYLDLSQSSKIKSLPKSISKLVNLQTLNLINCEMLQGLPTNFGNNTSIRTLYLTCQEMSLNRKCRPTFNSLQFLLLYNCDFVELPSEMHHFASLRVLRIYDCPRLTSLPQGMKNLTALEKLWIWNCEELDLCQGDGLCGLQSLQSLLLLGLPKLINLPEGLQKYVAKTLKFFRIATCVNFTDAPEWILSFTLLQTLCIEDCPSLSFFPEEVYGTIPKVQISGCPQVQIMVSTA